MTKSKSTSKPSPDIFPPKRTDLYVKAFATHWEKKHSNCSSTFHGESAEWYGSGCYAYPASRIAVGKERYVGVLYQGWDKEKEHAMCQGDNPEAHLWMEYLTDPDGPFREVFPWLVYKTAKEINQHHGYIIQGFNDPDFPNGLIWSWAMATRYMYENPKRMERFLYCVDKIKDRALALFVTLTLQPTGKDLAGLWGQTIIAHGEPLGNSGYRRSHAFLNGIVTPSGHHGTVGSSNSFGGPIHWDYSSRNIVPKLPFDDWVKCFQKERKGNVLDKLKVACAA